MMWEGGDQLSSKFVTLAAGVRGLRQSPASSWTAAAGVHGLQTPESRILRILGLLPSTSYELTFHNLSCGNVFI